MRELDSDKEETASHIIKYYEFHVFYLLNTLQINYNAQAISGNQRIYHVSVLYGS